MNVSGFGAAKHVIFINYILFSRVMISLFLCRDENDPLHRQHQSAELHCWLIQLITFFGCFLRMAEAMKASSARNSTIKAKPARSEGASRRKPKDTPTPTPTLDTKEFGNFIAFRASVCPGLLSDDIHIFGCGVERMSVGDKCILVMCKSCFRIIDGISMITTPAPAVGLFVGRSTNCHCQERMTAAEQRYCAHDSHMLYKFDDASVEFQDFQYTDIDGLVTESRSENIVMYFQ